jgi:outer membrane lipoprotein-sorting protein
MNRRCTVAVSTPVPRRAGLVAVLLLSSLPTIVMIAMGPARAGAQSPPVVGATPTIDAVLGRMARIQGLHCSYREEKRIALLTTPVVSEGTIDYARGAAGAARMARRTTRPSRQVVLIDGGELRMSDGRTTQRIDLASQPVVRSFVDSFLQLLVGDRAALERTYTLAIETPGEGRWALLLRPRAAPLTQFLREIRFEGRGDAMERMVMTEVSGDTTTTTFAEVDAARRYPDAEARTVFSLTP